MEREAGFAQLKFNQTSIAVTARDGLLEKDPAKVGELASKFTSGGLNQEKVLEEVAKISESHQAEILAEYKTGFIDWRKAWEKALELHAQGKTEEALVNVNTFIAPLRARMTEKLDAVMKVNEELSIAKEHDVAQHFYEALTVILGVSFVCVAFGLIAAVRILRAVNHSITNVVDNLRSNAEQVASAATQISSSSQSLSQATTEQAASLQETTSSLEEISAMIRKSSENADRSAGKSSESRGRAEEGQRAVSGMLVSMEAISQSNDAIVKQISDSNVRMTDIVRVIREIAEKTKVINEIVFQTKLLSFNASVEAARAGDHGKGFAVVAEEVGNLAQMSGNAAMEISEMLTSSISKVEMIAHETKTKVEAITDQGKLKVENGLEVAKQCSDFLKAIVEDVSEVAGLVQDISMASKEQTQGVVEINKAMNQLDAVTQQNASTSEEAASAAEQLSAQSGAMKDCVTELCRTIYGDAVVEDVKKPSSPVLTNSAMPKAKVVAMRKTTAKASADASKPATALKLAVGDSRVPPSREEDGFVDL